MALTLTPSPHRRATRVQILQKLSPYTDIYTNSPSRGLRESISPVSVPTVPTEPEQRWIRTDAPCARHINDKAPFSLWDNDSHDFRKLTNQEGEWIVDAYKATEISFEWPILIITTDQPPRPITLTVGGVPTRFLPPASTPPASLAGTAPYSNPRMPDPCPAITWPNHVNPTRHQMNELIKALQAFASIKKVYFFSYHITVELDIEDGVTYKPKSLPGKVGGKLTTYHHSNETFFNTMNSHGRERVIDPANYQTAGTSATLPNDDTDYLANSNLITPGVKVSSGQLMNAGPLANTSMSTTAGVFLRKGSQIRLTVAHHGFLGSTNVHHPNPTSQVIGQIVEMYPELDIAMVQMIPANQGRASNSQYFQAEVPRRLVGGSELRKWDWYELDSMSTGLLALFCDGITLAHPVRPAGHPKIEVSKWKPEAVLQVFGASNVTMRDGLCGAPIVYIGGGEVVGFFHLGNGMMAQSATLDDLVAEGWELK